MEEKQTSSLNFPHILIDYPATEPISPTHNKTFDSFVGIKRLTQPHLIYNYIPYYIIAIVGVVKHL